MPLEKERATGSIDNLVKFGHIVFEMQVEESAYT